MEEENKELTFKEKVKKYAPWVWGAVLVAGCVVFGICVLKSDNADISVPDINLKPSDIPPMDKVDVPDIPKKIDTPETINISKRNYTYPSEPFPVNSHVRNLPKGHHPSPEKVEEMTRKGIEPLDSITLVDDYMKNAS